MIRVGFSTSRRALSRFIRWVTRSKISHVFIVLDLPIFGACVLEAGDLGLTIVKRSSFERNNMTLYEAVPPVDLVAALTEHAHLLGTRYDGYGLWGMAFVYVGRRLKAKWRNPFRSSDVVFCSEFVARVMRSAKWPGAENLDPDSVSPQDLLEFVQT